MNAERRTRLWARDTRWLRIFSDWIGRLAVVAAIAQLGFGVLATWGLSLQETVAPLLLYFWAAILTALGGLFVMSAGRVLASIAEIAWFSSPENPQNISPDA